MHPIGLVVFNRVIKVFRQSEVWLLKPVRGNKGSRKRFRV
jgi:hypothetical protein